MSNELIEIKQETALEAFSKEDGLRAVIEQVRETVNSFEHDLSTEAGRGRTKSLARKVASLKTRLDGMGKDLTADWKAKAKAVDANRKIMRDELDELKAIARKPVTEWEEEQERIAAEKKAKEEAEALAKQVEVDHEIALLMNNEFDRVAAEKLAAEQEAERIRIENEEKARIEREKQIAEQARIQAEREAKEREERLIREAQEREAKAEAERVAAIAREEQLKREAKEAAERARAEEIRKQEEAEQARLAQQAEREANKRHVSKIRREAKESLMAIGLSEEDAKNVVLAIDGEKIKNVSIAY